jgi:hypothetical protein
MCAPDNVRSLGQSSCEFYRPCVGSIFGMDRQVLIKGFLKSRGTKRSNPFPSSKEPVNFWSYTQTAVILSRACGS